VITDNETSVGHLPQHFHCFSVMLVVFIYILLLDRNWMATLASAAGFVSNSLWAGVLFCCF